MRFFTYFLLAYVAVSAVFASDYQSIKHKVDLIHSQCQQLSQIPSSGITISAGAIIHADLQAVVNVFVEAKAEIVGFVGVLAVAEVKAIIAILAEIEILLNVAVNILLGLEVGLSILGLGDECGQDLLDLDVSVEAFIQAFLAIIPKNCNSCKTKAWDTCHKIQNDCHNACQVYGYC